MGAQLCMRLPAYGHKRPSPILSLLPLVSKSTLVSQWKSCSIYIFLYVVFSQVSFLSLYQTPKMPFLIHMQYILYIYNVSIHIIYIYDMINTYIWSCTAYVITLMLMLTLSPWPPGWSACSNSAKHANCHSRRKLVTLVRNRTRWLHLTCWKRSPRDRGHNDIKVYHGDIMEIQQG